MVWDRSGKVLSAKKYLYWFYTATTPKEASPLVLMLCNHTNKHHPLHTIAFA
jgi:hypothetical protein